MEPNTIAGLLLTFGSCGAAYYSKASPIAHFAPWMQSYFVSIIANVGGFIFGFLAIYLLISSLGWLYGILAWFGAGVISATIIGKSLNYIFPLVFMLSLISMASGILVWLIL